MKHPLQTAVARIALTGIAALLAACAAAPPAAPSNPAPTVTELMQRPAERALIEGIRAYDDGQYPVAEGHLRRALSASLPQPRDRANAHKLLAFITCTSERLADCATHFTAARAADPEFQLTRSEAGHPVWGPVYRRVLP